MGAGAERRSMNGPRSRRPNLCVTSVIRLATELAMESKDGLGWDGWAPLQAPGTGTA